jgi:hypothetical protein
MLLIYAGGVGGESYLSALYGGECYTLTLNCGHFTNGQD